MPAILNKPLKFWLNLLIYLAFIFLIWMLVKFDYFSLKGLKINILYLILSLLFLFTGYLFIPMAWQNILRHHRINVSYKESVVSEGKPIFAKYLPGKFMVLIGRAGYISLKGAPLTQTSIISFKAQMISLIVNLLIGSVVVFVLPVTVTEMIVWIGLTLSILLILFIRPVHNLAVRLVKTIFRSSATVNFINIRESLLAGFWYVAAYFFWGLGFTFLCFSISGKLMAVDIPLFSLATSVSIIAFIFPGGLGIREGTLVYFLVKSGLSPELSATISVLSRLWFLCGEIFYFALAFFLEKRLKNLSGKSMNDLNDN
ncbi:MAG TPA: lysylphosphatidylglycerol synthase domain-containing protein [Bacteroidia bacterium]|nr:lysylphosphatidylglycerol synthase domain-containing protein [Bacteroidia bacterium]HRS57817.1 lysylphosphatidylglycerol synthase domain-containing protein [Bacteroidia bacterium]HRU67883.1 lysylphosphatidylglycerol synthase domain-containing protein [Bacteroidia bacterium]